MSHNEEKLLISTAGDVTLFDLKKGETIYTVSNYLELRTHIGFCYDETKIISAYFDGTI